MPDQHDTEIDHWLAPYGDRLERLLPDDCDTYPPVVFLFIGGLCVVGGVSEIEDYELKWEERTVLGKILVSVELPSRFAFGTIMIVIGLSTIAAGLVFLSPAILLDRAPSYSSLVFKGESDGE